VNCTKCKAEWTPPAGRTITNCPFCGEAIYAATLAGKDSALHEMLHSIVQQFGREILGEARLRGWISDLMPNAEKKHLRILKQAVDDGIGAKLLEMDSDTFAVRTMKISSLKETFKNNNGFTNTADYVVECFMFALGWLKKSPVEKQENSLLHNMNILEHAAEMAFSDGKLTKEEAKSLFDLGDKLELPEREVEDVVKLYIDLYELKPDVPPGSNAVVTKAFIISQDWLAKNPVKIEEEHESVQIGDQVWMTRNLDVGHFRNGDPIPEAKTDEEWEKAGIMKKPVYCYYDNDPENGKHYGKLYNWYAVNDPRILAPEGWHVPRKYEWEKLFNFFIAHGFPNDNYYHKGTANALKSCRQKNSPMGGICDTSEHPRWESDDDIKRYGFDAYGFSALPGGERDADGIFIQLGFYGCWWSVTENSSIYSYLLMISHNGCLILGLAFKTLSLSIRCLKDIKSEHDSIKINNQVWMKKNLDVSRFRNGDQIPFAKTNEEWERAGREEKPAWCFYYNDPENGKIYGKLYNWYAVNDPRGIAPEGFHVPNNEEWGDLTINLGGWKEEGGKMKTTDTIFWASPNFGATNSSGFSGLPGGYRNDFGAFLMIGISSCFWSRSEGSMESAWSLSLAYDNACVTSDADDKGYGFSVRCLRDNDY
jgi:uncharacterized protein (TIGR02145 family)